MDEAAAQVLITVKGRKFEQAYRRSGPGRGIVVTFTSRRGQGWFRMEWALTEGRVFTGS